MRKVFDSWAMDVALVGLAVAAVAIAVYVVVGLAVTAVTALV